MQQKLTKTILSLCDYSGSWSQPYLDAGYEVVRIDLQNGQDVRLLEHPGKVHGILAAPPCRVFCRPGARLWEQWGDKELLDGLSIVDACLRLVAVCRPKWWALENPPGRLHRYLGPPQYEFHPWHHGDPYTKHTYLWGNFTIPERQPVQPEQYPDHLPPGRRDRKSESSLAARALACYTSRMAQPNPNAVALAKSRWARVSPAERSRAMSDLAKLAAKKLGKAGRAERARKAGSAPKRPRQS